MGLTYTHPGEALKQRGKDTMPESGRGYGVWQIIRNPCSDRWLESLELQNRYGFIRMELTFSINRLSKICIRSKQYKAEINKNVGIIHVK